MLLQLVLQFRGESLSKFLKLETLEAQIGSILGGSELFDGIDSQKNNVNIFIYTENPAQTFDRVRPIFEQAEQLLGFTAAYRLVAESRFHVLWPKDGTKFTLRSNSESQET